MVGGLVRRLRFINALQLQIDLHAITPAMANGVPPFMFKKEKFTYNRTEGKVLTNTAARDSMFRQYELLSLIPDSGLRHGEIKKAACGDPKIEGDTGIGMTTKQFNTTFGKCQMDALIGSNKAKVYTLTSKGTKEMNVFRSEQNAKEMGKPRNQK
jgi:hypothetical protein